MNLEIFSNEAEHCRKLATTITDHDESKFLLSVARAFDDLAIGRVNASVAASAEEMHGSNGSPPPKSSAASGLAG